MKAQRSCTHKDLTLHILTNCRPQFEADSSMIKDCIEVLIEKGYMERSAEDRDTYLYVA